MPIRYVPIGISMAMCDLRITALSTFTLLSFTISSNALFTAFPIELLQPDFSRKEIILDDQKLL